MARHRTFERRGEQLAGQRPRAQAQALGPQTPERANRPAADEGLDLGRVEEVSLADKGGDAPTDRLIVECTRRADLFDPTTIEKRNPVSGGQSLDLIVGDIDRGQARLAANPADGFAHRPAQARVKIRQRLVEEQHLGPDRDGAGEGHALLLATG